MSHLNLLNTFLAYFVIFVLAYFIWSFITQISRYIQEISNGKNKLNELNKQLEQDKKNLQVLSNEASYYLNTLGNDGASQISELSKLLDTQEMLIKKLDELCCLKQYDNSRVKEYNKLYETKNAQTKKIKEHLAAKIVEASVKSEEMGLPKARKRQATITNLRNQGLTSENSYRKVRKRTFTNFISFKR
jgi:DNA repair ATPase RecN